MQTRSQALLEVAVDYVFSILINIGGQLLFYSTVATTRRVTLFAGLVLGLALVRRFVLRRCFEALVPAGRSQPRWQSALEAVSDTGLGVGIAVVLQIIIYGDAATLLRASGLTVVIYSLTMLRRYLIRRFFAAWALRTASGEGAVPGPRTQNEK
jgi:hypothetical protein